MALFACAFNLLVGYSGLLSFGHALFFGAASYIAAHAAKVWGLAAGLAHPRRRPLPPPRSASSPAACRSAARAYISR